MDISRRQIAAGAALLAAPALARAKARALPSPAAADWDPPGLVREGYAMGPNGRVYYRVYGKAGRRAPLMVLHGGPVAGHRYMRPYAALARDRQVILYDQSGGGASAAPTDLRLYTVQRYVAELEALRAHLALPAMAVLGHSWGGMLAPAYAAAHPDRVRALVLAGTATRWADFQDAAARWLAELGPAAVATVRKAEATGKTDGPDYGRLLERYYALHLCRLAPWPAWFDAEAMKIAANPVYPYLNGPSEFQFTGKFASLDVAPALRGARVPTLVTCGEFDEGPPWVARKIAALVPGARLVVFDGLSHMSHIEDPRRVVAATAAFLDGAG